jgi:hypothetical protein
MPWPFCFVPEATVTEPELIAAFESTALPAEQFTHEAHVRVAWAYLRRAPLPTALAAFASALRRYAAAQGAAGKYHETITVAWMLLIAARIADTPHSVWTEFAAANPDLLQRQPSPLARYYSAGLLASDEARHGFVLPDLIAEG